MFHSLKQEIAHPQRLHPLNGKLHPQGILRMFIIQALFQTTVVKHAFDRQRMPQKQDFIRAMFRLVWKTLFFLVSLFCFLGFVCVVSISLSFVSIRQGLCMDNKKQYCFRSCNIFTRQTIGSFGAENMTCTAMRRQDWAYHSFVLFDDGHIADSGLDATCPNPPWLMHGT